MKKLIAHLMILTAFVAFSFAPAAFADTVSGTGGDCAVQPPPCFQTWGTTDLSSQSGFPYWNHNSYDGAQYNIGFVLTNTGGAAGTLSSPPGAIPFWGGAFTSGTAAGGAADPNFFFAKNSASGSAVLKAEITAHNHPGAPTNSFGWYDKANPFVLHPLIGATAGGATSATLTIPPANYGFYLETQDYFTDGGPLVDVVYETEAKNNFKTGSGELFDNPDQHFALFQESDALGNEVYWLGMEDLRFDRPGGAGDSDRDYQDMIIRIQYQDFVPPQAQIPEPSSMMLLGSGLVLGIGIALRRRVFKR